MFRRCIRYNACGFRTMSKDVNQDIIMDSINNRLIVREAREEDTSTILEFINQLASYEKLLHEVVATEDLLRESLFIQKHARVLLAEYDERPVGFALYFFNFSTFVGRPGLYLEDLFVYPEMRGHGIGKALLSSLARIAIEKGCGRFEWSCLDWNEPSINFYKSLGAIPMQDWTIYRMTGEALINLAKGK